VRHYLFALACFGFSAWLLWPVDNSLPPVVDYRSAPMFDPPTVEPKHLKATGYCACARCCGRWADGITFSGTVAAQGRTIAADPSVYPIGTCLELPGLGRRIVEDIGGAIAGESIDVFFDRHSDALEFGVALLPVRECRL